MKEYLSQKGIRYSERNLAVDRAAINDLKDMGFMTLPVTLINGEAVTGFNRDRIDELLNK